jgi:hypothetical protein
MKPLFVLSMADSSNIVVHLPKGGFPAYKIMKKVCFVVSHLGSGSGDLVEILNGNPRCEIQSSQARYSSPEDLEWLFSAPHKCRDSSAIYGDHLLFNSSFSCRSMYGFCRFIYVIRPARASLNEISTLAEAGLKGRFAARYYSFRLRRICEMARNTPDSLFLTWDDLASGKGFPAVEQHLGLKTQLRAEHHHFRACLKDDFDERSISECQDAYERYYYYLDRMGLKRAFI